MAEPALTIPVRSIVQVAYHVPDAETAARSLTKLYGWAPFFVLHHIGLESCTYRGQPAFLDHSAACGQAGPIMVELNQQNGGDYPSVFRDMYRADQTGIQHQAMERRRAQRRAHQVQVILDRRGHRRGTAAHAPSETKPLAGCPRVVAHSCPRL